MEGGTKGSLAEAVREASTWASAVACDGVREGCLGDSHDAYERDSGEFLEASVNAFPPEISSKIFYATVQ